LSKSAIVSNRLRISVRTVEPRPMRKMVIMLLSCL
jgi:hypothetical protein